MSRRDDELEAIAQRVTAERAARDAQASVIWEAHHAKIRAEVAAASIGPPKPRIPGLYAHGRDWGLREMRERLFWQLRREKWL